MRFKTLTLISCLLVSGICTAQHNAPDVQPDKYRSAWQWGTSVKASFYLYNGKPCLRISTCAGMAVLTADDNLLPTAHLAYDIYINGLGSRMPDPIKHAYLANELTVAVTLTGNIGGAKPDGAFTKDNRWNQPLYFFSNFSAPPLQNPYWSSLAIGTVWVMPIADPIKTRLCQPKPVIQRIGFFGLHSNGFDISYYNDGGPLITQTYLGDGHDRFHTGGGMAAYHPKVAGGVNEYELCFHKYTGYTEDAFEIADQIYLAATPYSDIRQHYYNFSDFGFHCGNTLEGWAASLRLNNLGNLFDIQHIIHYTQNYAYHVVPQPWGLSIGGDLWYSTTKLYTK